MANEKKKLLVGKSPRFVPSKLNTTPATRSGSVSRNVPENDRKNVAPDHYQIMAIVETSEAKPSDSEKREPLQSHPLRKAAKSSCSPCLREPGLVSARRMDPCGFREHYTDQGSPKSRGPGFEH